MTLVCLLTVGLRAIPSFHSAFALWFSALALERTSNLMGNRSGATHWALRAGTIAASLKRVLWSESRQACFDIDINGE